MPGLESRWFVSRSGTALPLHFSGLDRGTVFAASGLSVRSVHLRYLHRMEGRQRARDRLAVRLCCYVPIRSAKESEWIRWAILLSLRGGGSVPASVERRIFHLLHPRGSDNPLGWALGKSFSGAI